MQSGVLRSIRFLLSSITHSLQHSRSFLVAGCFSCLLFPAYSAQATDPQASPTHTLHSLLRAASLYHPSMRSAARSAEAADKDIEAAKRQRWAQISVVAETNSNKADVMASPTQVARLQQNLWDFGRVSSLVNQAEKTSALAQLQTQLQEQDLHIQVISVWQQLIASRRRMLVAQSHLEVLHTYESQMQRRVQAQASASIDLELVRSRVLQGQVDLTNSQAQFEHSLFLLEQLTGVKILAADIPALLPQVDAHNTLTPKLERLQQFNFSELAQQHAVVEAAQLQHQIAAEQIKTVTAEQFPQIYFRLDQPLSKVQPFNNTKPSWFVGLSYTPGAGFSGSSQVESQVMRAEAARENIAKAKLDIEREMLSDMRDFSSSVERLKSLELSVIGAQKVLESYQRQFQAGRKSWLDLLNAAREHSQSQYLLADTESTLAAAYERLQLRITATGRVFAAHPAQ